MNKLFYTFSKALIFLALLMACEQADIANIDNSSAVVSAYLFVGKPVDSILITESFSYAREDTILYTLDDLSISLSDEKNTHILQSIGNGFYQNMDVVVQEDATYNLSFSFNDELITASTYTPIKKEVTISSNEISLAQIDFTQGRPQIGGNLNSDPIELTWDNSEGDYYYVVVENIEQNPEDVIILPDGGFRGRRFAFISEPEITNFYAIQARRELQQYGTHRVVVYRVNPEYAALYNLNGSSSISITEPPSNINNGLGIFIGVSSDTVYVEVKKE